MACCAARRLRRPAGITQIHFRPASAQPTNRFGREPIGQPALDLATRLIAGLDADPLECAGRWDDDPALPALPHHQLGKMNEPVVLDRVRQQPAGQIRGRTRPERTKPEAVLQFGHGGLPKMAQKLAEEATEVVIKAVRRDRSAVIHESVDLLYNLVVLWSELGITSPEIWAEMDRRQALFGMAEKLPKEVGVGSTSPAGY